jgi:hypothetical protein
MHKCSNNLSIISKGKIVTGCEICIGQKIETGEYSAKFNREWQKGHYRKELTQPNEPHKFVKAYGKKALDYGYSEEQLRRYS